MLRPRSRARVKAQTVSMRGQLFMQMVVKDKGEACGLRLDAVADLLEGGVKR